MSERAPPGRDAVLLVEKVGAVAGKAGELVAEIDIARFLENLDLVLRGDLVNERLEVVVLHGGHVDADELAMDAQHRRIAGGEMKVRSVLLLHELEKKSTPLVA